DELLDPVRRARQRVEVAQDQPDGARSLLRLQVFPAHGGFERALERPRQLARGRTLAAREELLQPLDRAGQPRLRRDADVERAVALERVLRLRAITPELRVAHLAEQLAALLAALLQGLEQGRGALEQSARLGVEHGAIHVPELDGAALFQAHRLLLL